MRLIFDDVRFAWRQLRRTPGFALVAVLTLALGIGATTAFFGVVSALLYPPETVNFADVYNVFSQYPDTPGRDIGMQRADFRALEANRPASVLATTAVDEFSCVVQTPGRAERVGCEHVTTGYADTLRIAVASGRWFVKDDERPIGGDTAIISDRLWRTLFRADTGLLGDTPIKFGGMWRRVIGVMPPGFRGVWNGTDVWVLQATAPGAARPPDWWKQKRWPGVRTLVRTRPGAPRDEVNAQIGMTVAAAAPGPESTRTTFRIGDANPRTAGTLGFWILAFAALVFFAACANLANMLYARNTQRAPEIAVRLSLGASRARIIRLFVAEAAIISGVAAAAGLAIAIGVSRVFSETFPSLRLSPYSRATIDTAVDLDARVFLFALALGVAAALFVGLTSALRSTRITALRTVAASGSVGMTPVPARGLQTSLVSIQITAAVLLVMAATMFLENTRKAYDRKVAFETSRLTAARIELEPWEMTSSGSVVRAWPEAAGRQFYERLIQAARSMPGVQAAALVDVVPGSTSPGPRFRLACFRPEDPPDGLRANIRRADGARIIGSDQLLKTLSVEIRRGRDLAASDAFGGPPVAVVSESVAASLWPGGDAVGKRMYDCWSRDWLTVVGVSANVVTNRGTAENYVFLPFDQRYQAAMLLVVQTAAPEGRVDAIRALIGNLDRDVPVFEVAPADDFLLAGVALGRASRTLALSLGALSLGIAVLGVYGVVAYFVSRRTREFGLRLALGASRRQVLKMVVDHAIHIVLVGLVPAVLVASLGTRYLTQTVAKFLPGDIAPWVQVPVLMLVAGVIAAYIPARRAAGVDPNVALRAE